MVNVYPILVEIKEKLSELEGIKSLRIGLEKGSDSAFNAPLIRVVANSVQAKGLRETLSFKIIMAFDTKNDLELLYEKFYNTEYEIKKLLLSLNYEIFFISSVSDEDRLSSLKAGAMIFEIRNLLGVLR